jgi:hypothetical protein
MMVTVQNTGRKAQRSSSTLLHDDAGILFSWQPLFLLACFRWSTMTPNTIAGTLNETWTKGNVSKR